MILKFHGRSECILQNLMKRKRQAFKSEALNEKMCVHSELRALLFYRLLVEL